MHWFLIVSMFGTDELLVKQLNTRQECLRMAKDFKLKMKKKMNQIEDVYCEEGEIFETYDAGAKKDEVL